MQGGLDKSRISMRLSTLSQRYLLIILIPDRRAPKAWEQSGDGGHRLGVARGLYDNICSKDQPIASYVAVRGSFAVLHFLLSRFPLLFDWISEFPTARPRAEAAEACADSLQSTAHLRSKDCSFFGLVSKFIDGDKYSGL